MTEQFIQSAFDAGLSAGLIIVGIGFAILAAWPYWKERDREERKRKYELEKAQNDTQGLTAGAISLLGDRMDKPMRIITDAPIRVLLERPTGDGI